MSQQNTSRGGARPRGTTSVEVDGLRCSMHMPPATLSRYDGSGEVAQRLAPSAIQEIFLVDDFTACPRDWLRSDPTTGTVACFVRAKPGHMVWFDLNANGRHPHHVAAIISAQGINAITGRKMAPPVRLEQYLTRCPVHDTAFGPKKRCADCGFDWPDQNYIATTAVGTGAFWRDGFRAVDGKTREFIFTEDVERGVAANVIGDARMDAFGVRLYLSREPRPRPAYDGRRGGLETLGGGAMRSLRSTPKSIEVGAGAIVQQEVERDPSRLDSWQDEPAATFVIYYVGAEEFEEILASGGGRTGGNEGFLGKIPVGTP